MSTVAAVSPAKPHAGGRMHLWGGIGLALLAIALCFAQYSVKSLIVPWYLPGLTTLGACLVVYSLLRRVSVVRVLALGLIGALAAFEWYFLMALTLLPGYDGPARAGQTIPAFQTTLADGRPFSDKDLRSGKPSVVLFFRGRW